MNSLAYIFTVGPGELSRQGLYLLRSIQKNTRAEKEDIFVFIVKSEKDEINDEVLEELKEKSTVLEGEMPNKEYPLSAAQGALKSASKNTNHDYLLLLDTDTVVLEDVEVHKHNNAELFLAPEVISRRFWASKKKSEELLKKIFDEYGFSFPDTKLKSNYDREEINPYYNSGVILTKNSDFPERFVDLSKEVHGNLPQKNYFSEMVSLSMLASEYEVYSLGPEYNFFQARRLYPQEGIKIVHYLDTRSLFRGVILSEKLGSGWFSYKLRGTGVHSDWDEKGRIRRKISFLAEANKAYNSRIKDRDLVNYKIRKILIKGLEVTGTKQLARNLTNLILREKKFREQSY